MLKTPPLVNCSLPTESNMRLTTGNWPQKICNKYLLLDPQTSEDMREVLMKVSEELRSDVQCLGLY